MSLFKNLLAVTVLATVMTPARSQYISSGDPVLAKIPPVFPLQKGISNTVKGIPGNLKDSVPAPETIDWRTVDDARNKPFPFRSLILPGALVAYGFTALHSEHLQSLNRDVKEEMWTDNPHKKLGIDTYMMLAPGLAVYGLNAAGIQGKHNFKDRTMIYMLSSLIANAAVFSLKDVTHTLRPDGSNYNSFPSGHTSEAFASAEFMRQEYKDVSPWYGVAGYAMATATGMLRMYNDKHWFNDVVAGAGFGIASTRVAYWLYPIMQRAFGKGRPTNTVVMPTYQGGSFGLALAHHF